MKKKLTTFCINLFVLLPLLALISFYYPMINFEVDRMLGVQAQDVLEKNENAFAIRIPSLGISEKVTPKINPFDKEEYMQALSKGIAHSSTSVTPDEKGSVYLFAHNSDNPFSMYRYNTAFYGLSKIKTGDVILVDYLQNTYTYSVAKKEVVFDSDIDRIIDSTEDVLILQTCVFNNRSKRLLVYALPL